MRRQNYGPRRENPKEACPYRRAAGTESEHVAYKTQDRKELSDRFASPEKYVGYWLCDPQGREIGRVKKLYLNGYDEPEYVEVKMGLFGRKVVLIPVIGVALNEAKKSLVVQ